MAIALGRFNILKVVKKVDFGMYLDGGEEGRILLPARYVPQGCEVGDELNVFLYLDNEERLVATTQQPLARTMKSGWWPPRSSRWRKWATLPACVWHGSTSTARFWTGG